MTIENRLTLLEAKEFLEYLKGIYTKRFGKHYALVQDTYGVYSICGLNYALCLFPFIKIIMTTHERSIK